MTHDPPKVTAGCLVYFVQEWNVNKFKDTFTKLDMMFKGVKCLY